MRSKIIVIVIAVIILVVSGCSYKKDDFRDFYNSIKIEDYIKNQDYETLKGMYYDDRIAISKEEFEHLSEIINNSMKGQSSFSKYEIIEYENGSMLLVQFGEKDGEPKVINIKLVSEKLADDLKELLNIQSK